MVRIRNALVGAPVPKALVAAIHDGKIMPVDIFDLVQQGQYLIIGVPGAFAPVCTTDHLPTLVAYADRLGLSGFTRVYCVAASDPFSVAHWAETIDPQGKITFLSDGNLNFAKAIELDCGAEELFMGRRSQRYLMNVRDGKVTRLRVEPHHTAFDRSDPRKVHRQANEVLDLDVAFL